MKNDHFDQLKSHEGKHYTASKSAAGRWLNYKLIHVEPGEIEASLVIRDEHTNPLKQLHGGMIALICDEICGLCFYSLGFETFYTTISLNIDFLLGVAKDSEITIKAKVIRSGKRISNVECFLYDEQGMKLAHATTNLMNSGLKYLT